MGIICQRLDSGVSRGCVVRAHGLRNRLLAPGTPPAERGGPLPPSTWPAGSTALPGGWRQPPARTPRSSCPRSCCWRMRAKHSLRWPRSDRSHRPSPRPPAGLWPRRSAGRPIWSAPGRNWPAAGIPCVTTRSCRPARPAPGRAAFREPCSYLMATTWQKACACPVHQPWSVAPGANGIEHHGIEGARPGLTSATSLT